MGLGPIEVLEIGFPGNQFNGEILPELERLVEAGTITVVDGVLIRRDEDEVTFAEFGEVSGDPAIDRLAAIMQQVESLISDEDVNELAAGLQPNSSAAILVFEHTWAKPLRDAIVGSGGYLAADFLLPGQAVDELLDELEAVD